ncbi:phosphatidylinositol 3 and 4-kinase-domain-containing protein [Phakopsora pachyrhizi]|uniref:Phosphatidylinositol 4-kinase n=1 Tax=Phakopsora pachyrhizi TaxID=170000 RepID=A0AAV0B905_PHAPC|nr:phosphatidylinositol 3 and 4-kinase-domain-containing protein [Phakopsora pachyrhizi]
MTSSNTIQQQQQQQQPETSPTSNQIASSSRRDSPKRLKKRLRANVSRRPVVAFSSVLNNPSTTSRPINLKTNTSRRTLDHLDPTTPDQFRSIVESVIRSIDHPVRPILPKLNGSGSSGSYFCRTCVSNVNDLKASGTIETVGIFKPKDEEPYGAMNPKWTKWAHRVLLAPLIGGFGRSWQAAASLLDRRLETFIVPRTEVVSISSPTFFYSWLDRRKPELPPKPGSFQLFCHGFQNASVVFKENPWPGFPISESYEYRHRKRCNRFSLYRLFCGHRLDLETEEDQSNHNDEDHDDRKLEVGCSDPGKTWYWTNELMEDFRIELEKLVILDYLMRNTDRGLDNFMIKICNSQACGSVRSRKTSCNTATTSESNGDGSETQPTNSSSDYRYRNHCHVAAIDNSLAFPHHHPNGWRNYAYGWLFLPASLIGRPFSLSTRQHYLPLLSSAQWWAETVFELRKLFGTDPDFNVTMFERQIAVLKGQAWNILESLRHEDEGPLELCRRQKALVWDEAIEVAIGSKTRKAKDRLDQDDDQMGLTSEPYKAQSPMRIISPKRPLARRKWSMRANESSGKMPRKPIGLASHQFDIDGARGFDVIKRMDAIDAWQIEGESQNVTGPSGYGTFRGGRSSSVSEVGSKVGKGGRTCLSEGDERDDESGEGSDESETEQDDDDDDINIADIDHEEESFGMDESERLIKSDSKKVCKKSAGNVKPLGGERRRRKFRIKRREVSFIERIEFVNVQPVFKNC